MPDTRNLAGAIAMTAVSTSTTFGLPMKKA
jgi:hypothetical protein